jgi:hypothetical protein
MRSTKTKPNKKGPTDTQLLNFMERQCGIVERVNGYWVARYPGSSRWLGIADTPRKALLKAWNNDGSLPVGYIKERP